MDYELRYNMLVRFIQGAREGIKNPSNTQHEAVGWYEKGLLDALDAVLDEVNRLNTLGSKSN